MRLPPLPSTPPETKVVAGGMTGYIVGLVLQLLQTYVPHFTAPPAATVALIVSTLSAIAAYWAPHTPRAGDAPGPPTTPTPPAGSSAP